MVNEWSEVKYIAQGSCTKANCCCILGQGQFCPATIGNVHDDCRRKCLYFELVLLEIVLVVAMPVDSTTAQRNQTED